MGRCFELTLELRWAGGCLCSRFQRGTHGWIGCRTLGGAACMALPFHCELLHALSCSRFCSLLPPPLPPPCSQNKWPDEAGLAGLWEDNKDALLAFPLAAAYGGCALVGF